MNDQKQQPNIQDTKPNADQANPEDGTRKPEESIEREVGARTPERVKRTQVENAGVEDANGEGNVTPELAPKQTTGGPAELDRVPTDS